MISNQFENHLCTNILTLSTIITSQVEWTLAVEASSKVDTGRCWWARVLFAVNNVFITVLAWRIKPHYVTNQ